VPTPLQGSEGKTVYVAITRHTRAPRGHRPQTRLETLCTGTGISHPQSITKFVLRIQTEQDSDVRGWEVGQPHSTEEALNEDKHSAERAEERGLKCLSKFHGFIMPRSSTLRRLTAPDTIDDKILHANPNRRNRPRPIHRIYYHLPPVLPSLPPIVSSCVQD
jgi:hypothetical protein